MTKTNTSAGGGSIPIPEGIRNINAYTLGGRSVHAAATTKGVWVIKWYDLGKEREAATAMIAQGLDVLMHNTDAAAVVHTAQDKGEYAIGWDSDISKMGPKAHLGASVWN